MALYVRRKEDGEIKQVTGIYKGTETGPKVVSAVYLGLKLLWQYIKSCYGRGYWINDKLWSDTDAWVN
jgi:hypothetical protein